MLTLGVIHEGPAFFSERLSDANAASKRAPKSFGGGGIGPRRTTRRAKAAVAPVSLHYRSEFMRAGGEEVFAGGSEHRKRVQLRLPGRREATDKRRNSRATLPMQRIHQNVAGGFVTGDIRRCTQWKSRLAGAYDRHLHPEKPEMPKKILVKQQEWSSEHHCDGVSLSLFGVVIPNRSSTWIPVFLDVVF